MADKIEHISESDVLNAGREKINKFAIDPALRAESNSIDAKNIANQANQTSQRAEAIAINTDDRLDNIIVGEMQDAEVIDARRPFGSEAYQTLGERLDSEKAEVNAQLAQNKRRAFAKGVYVEDYDHLKIAIAAGYDYQPAIQAAFDEAALNNSAVVFPSGKTLLVRNSSRLKNNNGNYLFGNGCTIKRVGLTESSQSPIFYFLGLKEDGANTKDNGYSYNSGVYIYDLKFDGEGFGVGYKHAIAGQLHLYNCRTTNNLEIGVKLIGTNGVSFNGCYLAGNNKGVFCALIKDDLSTVNYTAEWSGWNDGIYFNHCFIQTSANGYGVYYSGSTSEGVIKFSNCLFAGSLNATGVYAKTFTNFVVDGGWSEFFVGGVVFESAKDSVGYEPSIMVVRDFQFTNYDGRKADYNVKSTAVKTVIEDCVIQGNTNIKPIKFSAGTKDTSTFSIEKTPTNLGGLGNISFEKTGIPNIDPLIMTQSGKKYYLQYNQGYPSGSYQYSMYTFSKIRKSESFNNKYVDGDYVLTKYTDTPTDNSVSSLKPAFEEESATMYLNRNIFMGIPDRNNWIETSAYGRVVGEGNMAR
ncbi:MAG: hypothetical protein ACLUQ0_05335 [Enterococcus italicus]|uniref:hypothetical protein n=1 Tax=Enterococcus italicus TaxID=246144 RepID=UPI0039967D63